MKVKRPPLEGNPSGIGFRDIGQAFEEYGFARSTGPQNGKKAAARHGEADTLEHGVPAEAFLQIVHFEQVLAALGAGVCMLVERRHGIR